MASDISRFCCSFLCEVSFLHLLEGGLVCFPLLIVLLLLWFFHRQLTFWDFMVPVSQFYLDLFFLWFCCPCFVQFWFHSLHFLLSVGPCPGRGVLEGPFQGSMEAHCCSPFRPAFTCYWSGQNLSLFQLFIWCWSIVLSSGARNSRAVGFLLFCQPQTCHCFSLLSSAQSSVT